MATQSATATVTGANHQGLQVGNNLGTIKFVTEVRAGMSLPYSTLAATQGH